MDREQLLKKHRKYELNIKDWLFWGKAYDGGRPFIQEVLLRNPRESDENYRQRISEAFNFNYPKAIVDLFNFYLTEKPNHRNLGDLTNDKQWQMFFKDCDLQNTNFDIFINECQKIASVYGSIGVLVNKQQTVANTVKAELENGVYPYCSLYTLPHIWDWQFEDDPISGRPTLTYLKLENADDTWTVWYPTYWEKWYYAEEMKFKKPELVGAGELTIGEIPFVWMPNIRSMTDWYLGVSDIDEISLITASIVRNLSCGEEVIKFAGFPMLRVPMRTEMDMPYEEKVGVTAVKEFDPSHGDGGKPDWMPTEIAEPIDSILRWTDRKIDELHRIAHLSGVYGQRRSKNAVSSGLSLRYEFQQLNTSLMQKATFMAEAEMRIIELWLKWQNKPELKADISVERSKAFSVDDLSVSIDNLIKTMGQVPSETYSFAARRYMVRRTLPDLPEKTFLQIEEELARAGDEKPADDAPDDNPEAPDDSGLESGPKEVETKA